MRLKLSILFLLVLPVLAQTTVKTTGTTTIASTGATTVKAAATATLLLDQVAGATGAFSMRELNSSYTSALIKVRRSSDNAESDFFQGASAGTLNTTRGGGGTELAAWVGGGNNGFVKTWYDQSGNARNFTQATTAQQPQIVSSGSIITGSNSKPAMQWDNVDDNMASANSFFSTTAYTAWVTFDATGIDTANSASYNNDALFAGDVSGTFYSGLHLHQTSGVAIFNWDGNEDAVYKTISTATWYLCETRHESGTIYVATNGGSDQSIASGTTSSNPTNFTLGHGTAGATYFYGTMQEVVFYSTALSSGDRTTGRSNINIYYAIY